jgi:hypothetical protein
MVRLSTACAPMLSNVDRGAAFGEVSSRRACRHLRALTTVPSVLRTTMALLPPLPRRLRLVEDARLRCLCLGHRTSSAHHLRA